MQVGEHLRSVLSPLLFAIMVDVITENAKEGLMNESLHANETVLISESTEKIRKIFEMEKGV